MFQTRDKGCQKLSIDFANGGGKMSDTGFIREKLEVKFLILFVLASFDTEASFDDVLASTLVDGAITYFDISDAFYELVESGHIEKNGELYKITQKGKEIIESCESRLPASVRREAQRAVLRAVAKSKRNSMISCETKEISQNHLVTSLKMNDDRGEIIKIELMVINRQQAAMLENNFKSNAEMIYNEVLKALLRDYSEDMPDLR
jgi:hypothetical protein